MEISIIKLVNGETLLAEVTHEDKEHMSIIDPIEVISPPIGLLILSPI